MNAEPILLIAAAVAFLLAGLVKGVIGLGLPLTALSVLTLVVGLREAIPLIIIPVLVTNAVQMLQGNALFALFKRYWLLILTLAVGAWAGTRLLFMVDELLVGALLGVIVIVYSLINIFAIRFRISDKHERYWSAPVGIFTGVLTGLTGSVGVPLAIYFQALRLDRETFLQSVSLCFFLTALPWSATLIDEGALNLETGTIGIAALIPSFAGMWLGQKIRVRLSQEVFSKGVFAFLIIVGANLIRRAVF